MRNYILYNPLAGHGDHEAQLDKLQTMLEGEAIRQDIREIESYKDFILALTEEDRIILCGGDGTLNRFINEVDTDALENEVLYYAIGSGNDFLHDIDGQSQDKPFRINQYLKNLPTVEVKGKSYKFINGIGYGLDGYCCEVGDKKKAENKSVNYTAIAIGGLLFHYKRANATVIVDGVSHEYKKVWIASVMNGRFYGGGIKMAPQQERLNEERTLSSVIVHGSGRLKTLMVFPTVSKGEHLGRTEMVAAFTGKEFTIKFDAPTPLQIDGETILGVTEYTVKAACPSYKD